MADPEVRRGMGDLLVEEYMEDDEDVTSPPAGASYAPGASSSDEGEPRRDSSGSAVPRVPTGPPSGGLVSVCSGATAATAVVQPTWPGPLPSPAFRDVGSAGARSGSSQGPPSVVLSGGGSAGCGGGSPAEVGSQGGPDGPAQGAPLAGVAVASTVRDEDSGSVRPPGPP